MEIDLQELMMGFLDISNAKRGTKLIVLLALEDEDEQFEMCHYLSDNPEASDHDILRMAYKIAKPREDVYFRDPDS